MSLFVTVSQNFKEHRFIPIYKIYAGVSSVVTEKKSFDNRFYSLVINVLNSIHYLFKRSSLKKWTVYSSYAYSFIGCVIKKCLFLLQCVI